MQTSQSTTPHGRRPYSLALMETQIVAQSCPAETIAHKWQVLDDIRKAKDATRPFRPHHRGSQRSSFLPPGNDPHRRGADRRLPLEQESGSAGERHGRELVETLLKRLVFSA